MWTSKARTGILGAIASTAALVVGAIGGPGAIAAPVIALDTPSPENVAVCGNLADLISGEQKATLDKIADVSPYFFMSGDDIGLALSETQLKEDFGFTQGEYEFLQRDDLAVANGDASLQGPQTRDLRGSCSGWYISNSDLVGGAFAIIGTAAGASLEALAAAFVAVSSMIGDR